MIVEFEPPTMLVNYISVKAASLRHHRLCCHCAARRRPGSSKEMTLQLLSLWDCSLISVWNVVVFPTAFSHGSVKGPECRWCSVGMTLITNCRDLASRPDGEGGTLTMQRPLNCTFHDTARTKVWCSLQRRRRQTGRKIHCVATPPPTPPCLELS